MMDAVKARHLIDMDHQLQATSKATGIDYEAMAVFSQDEEELTSNPANAIRRLPLDLEMMTEKHLLFEAAKPNLSVEAVSHTEDLVRRYGWPSIIMAQRKKYGTTTMIDGKMFQIDLLETSISRMRLL
jgi:hypothetical protein